MCIATCLFHIILALLDVKCDVVSGFWGNCSWVRAVQLRKAVLPSKGSTQTGYQTIIFWSAEFQDIRLSIIVPVQENIWVFQFFNITLSHPGVKFSRWETTHTLVGHICWLARWLHPKFQFNVITQTLLVTVDVLHLVAVWMWPSVPRLRECSCLRESKELSWLLTNHHQWLIFLASPTPPPK